MRAVEAFATVIGHARFGITLIPTLSFMNECLLPPCAVKCNKSRLGSLILGLAVLVPSCIFASPIGGGTINDPADAHLSIQPAYDYSGDAQNTGYVLAKNWDFGANGTISNYSELEIDFEYTDPFGVFCVGGKYGSMTAARSSSTAKTMGGVTQPIDGVTVASPMREWQSDYMRTFVKPLNSVSGSYVSSGTVDSLSSKEVANGSFYSKFSLPGGGEHLGLDMIWETRVRFEPIEKFWFSLWTVGDAWAKKYPPLDNGGAEMDLVESFGDTASNYDGNRWHSSLVGYGELWDFYLGSWVHGMKAFDIIAEDSSETHLPASYDPSEWHIWTWIYKADNTWEAYVDGKMVNRGMVHWTFGGDEDDPPIPMYFLFDGAWGHSEVGGMQGSMLKSKLANLHYDWDYSRVFLREPSSVTGPKNLSYGSYIWSDTDTFEDDKSSYVYTVQKDYSRQVNERHRANLILDGLDYTWWDSDNVWSPHYVIVDMKGTKTITQFALKPKDDLPYQYTIETSMDNDFGSEYSAPNPLVDNTGNTQDGPFVHDVAPTVARYVRLRVTGLHNGDNRVYIEDFDIMGYDGVVSGGETNVAPAGTISAVSGVFFNLPENDASNLIDGNMNTRWLAGAWQIPIESPVRYVEVDLGSNLEISKTVLHPEVSRAYQYIIEAKPEGGSYSTIVDRTANTEPSAITDSFSPVTVRYVKLTITGVHNYDKGWVSLSELEIIGSSTGGTGTSGPLNIVDVEYSAQQTGNEAINTIDDDFSTRWSAQGTHSINWNLGAVKSIEEIQLAFFNTHHYYFDIEVSDDRVNWTTVLANQTSGGQHENLESFSFGSLIDAQYVRYVGYGCDSPWTSTWNNLLEVEIIGQ